MNHRASMPERAPLSAAEREAENARLERARVTGQVRRQACEACGARPYGPCQAKPPGDHLARWSAALTVRRITRAEFAGALARVKRPARLAVVPERAS